jgi:transcriptional regulator with XRE-family HTH domain
LKSNIGKLIKFYRKKLGLTQTELSKLTGISQSTISDYEKGNIIPSISNIKKIAKALNIEPKLFFMEKEIDYPELNFIPIIGFLTNFEKLKKPLDYIGIPKGMEGDFAIVVDDESNEPKIPKNSIAILKTISTPVEILEDNFVMIKHEDKHYIRKVHFKSNKIYLSPLNENYQTFVINLEDIQKIEGLITYILMRLKF